MNKRIPALAVAMALALGAMLTSVPVAYASPTCFGNACNGGDPEVYGCAADAQTLVSGNGGPGTIELRYSPHCNAAWARLVNGVAGEQFGLNNDLGQHQNYAINPGYTYAWSNMVGATPGEFGHVFTNNDTYNWTAP